MTFRAGQVGEQGRVIPGARTYLEDVVTGHDTELLQHERDDRRLGRGADGRVVEVPLGRHHVVGVRTGQRDAGHEQVPGHRAQGGLDRARAQHLPGPELGDESVP